jgi:eukaryotic-like serine/threonine-protein kinase
VSDPSSLPEGTLVAGKLRVVRLLGAGGMGAVYEVEHEFTKHRRALKMLHRDLLTYPTVVARFLREASAAGHIGNPHIVETFDAGTLDTGEPYIVMEMLHGETLDARLARERRLPLVDLVDILGQACDAVEAAHATGIVHRDLKPENIFLLDQGGKPFVKILDFGISKFDAALTGANGTTKEGTTLGTPYYMSPEQVNGDKDLDARTDIYALGVILYECSAGQRPFEADGLPRLSVMIHEGTPMPLLERDPELPPAFVEVVSRAMAKDKSQRFSSAHELGASLAPFGAQALNATLPESALVTRAISDRPLSRRPPSDRPSASPGVAARFSSRPAVVPRPSSRPSSSPPGAASASAVSRVVVETPSSRMKEGENRALGPTMAGSAISVAEEKTSRGKWIAIAVAGTLLVGGGVAGVSWMSSGEGNRGPSTPVRDQAGAAAAAQPPSASVAPLPDTPPAAISTSLPPPLTTVSATPSAQAGTPSLPAASAAPKPSASGGPAKPPPAASGKAGTRVDQTGLAGDNPFK